ncbi:MAG TPA: hypothetical protein PL009_14575 [Flavipsychrobacter sp.]|mgnify:CR=1 FL=1|nr:hypothetical protein [Flavipsychrobacter sp.]
MLRKIIAVIVGIVAATLLFMGFESIIERLYPLPHGTDRADHAAMEAYVKTLPSTALILVLAGWAVGSFICGLLIRIIARSADKTPAYIAGLFLTTAGIVDIFMVPHPIWFIIIGILLFIPFTLIGHSLYRKK